MYTSQEFILYIEIDEHEHKWNNGNYACDEKRMSDLYDETPGKKVLFIRYNPHAYKSIAKNINVNDRRKILLGTMKYAMKNFDDNKHLEVWYLFYSQNNSRLSKNLPNKILYDVPQ